ncbi:MAG: hypothetical protein CO105_05845 [Comamonadaceae bacterium CG_4_9_14_3_um_filter_60_33]|nr:MAG: hypothetical protein AUK51_02340 [Comamonadaceae bacterium CG2_30_59_20]PIY27855.1 MAG: hypothetical protein COZ09_12975 [Comamonadaceae bacterium CG_4_10_14_3_um_filter_60_42]PJB44636.1 MAG: hypothetical protein CO105_05845 [Comamonadaceae bacterium CG_4_9_14_3_um_filter_60_33]
MPVAPHLQGLSTAELVAMRAAGADVTECYRVLTKGELNIVGEVLRGGGEFIELNHFPDDDVFDQATQSQYYYHAHRGLAGEHGHFHTFLRPPGMPEGMQPVAHKNASEPWPEGREALSHLIGISMDAYGFPMGLFTTNRWVTAEAWYRAEDVMQLLERFQIDHAAPSWPVNRWISALFVLFRPQMRQLLLERDKKVAQWAAQHPGADVFEDRALDITSWVAISVEDQINQVNVLLGQSQA